ncbi:MAG: hypothetical protein H7256_00965 [Bdellovibrio sp.]|nr:hypothetical protein [Bdellovibrio sp.]
MITERLDLLRSKILKETLKVSFFRSLFLDRANRILFLSLLALAFYLTTSLFFPLCVLLMGPIIWGVPHIISSLRYNTQFNTKTSERKKAVIFQSMIWLAVFSYRIAVDIYNQNLFISSYPLIFESICLVLSFAGQIYFVRQFNWKLILFSGLFSFLIYSTYVFPIQTALVLLIGHNYIPLYAWFKSCQQSKDFQIFSTVTSIYILLSIAIYFGLFDSLYSIYSPQGQIQFLNWNYADVVKSFGANPSDYQFWFHIVSLYAFSQAMHYFFWVKAIPENYQPQQHPPSFKCSQNRLANDFGSTSIYALAALVFLGLVYWLFFEFQTARLVYFSIASYHGFMEISALPFLKSNRKELSK